MQLAGLQGKVRSITFFNGRFGHSFVPQITYPNFCVPFVAFWCVPISKRSEVAWLLELLCNRRFEFAVKLQGVKMNLR